MIIQCPQCKSRYRTRVLSTGQSPLQIKCPNCTHQFLVDPEPSGMPDIAAEKQTILMVDDARFFRDLMLDLLQEFKANLLTADSAEDAWVLLHKHAVDLLIIDINLPDKNGLDLIREIREDPSFSKLRILCISGVYRKDDDAVAAVRAGADDFISKSFRPQELQLRIEKLLHK